MSKSWGFTIINIHFLLHRSVGCLWLSWAPGLAVLGSRLWVGFPSASPVPAALWGMFFLLQTTEM